MLIDLYGVFQQFTRFYVDINTSIYRRSIRVIMSDTNRSK